MNTFPVPRRASSETEEITINETTTVNRPGKKGQPTVIRHTATIARFVSRPYRMDDIISILLSGGWFDYDAEFDTPATKDFATRAQALIHRWRKENG